MRQGLVSKILSELDKRAKEDGYAPFWQSFGSVLKEGLVQDREHQEKILELCRFKSTAVEGWTSLADVASRMKEGQDAIYYASGESAEALRALPQLEGYLKRGVDVLLLTDHVDDFWLQHVAEYKGKKLRSITRGADDLAKIKDTQTKEDEAPPAGEFDALLALLRLTLEKDVKDVRLSQRLEGSAVCLVADDKDLDFHLEKLLRQHKQIAAASKRILEINPRHALIRGLATAATSEGGGAAVADAARLLLDQARIVGGEAVPDPASFARRIENALLACLGRR
jgi:molecular chaperone HtpG